MGYQLPDLGVGIEDHIAQLIVDELGFAHRALEPEQQAIVEVGWIVHAIFVEDEGVGQGTDFQQPMPVRIVSGEPGYLQPHDDPRSPQADIGHQALEAFTPRC